jgi:hypothetical protein
MEKSCRVTGMSNEMDSSEVFMISDIGTESDSNDNCDDSSTYSDSEWHKLVIELLIDDKFKSLHITVK